jgi:hypothetical protein
MMTKIKPQQNRLRYRLEEVENGWILTTSVVNGANDLGVLSRKVYEELSDALTGIEEHWDNEIQRLIDGN